MQRADKEIHSREEIDAVINNCDVCRLAFAVSNEPYLVPVSFGYDGESIYFHSAKTGRKINSIAANNRVCFEFENNVCLRKHADQACKWSFSFESVIGFGAVHELLLPEQKTNGLNKIMKHYSGRSWEIAEAQISRTRVWEIQIESISGKRAGQKEGR